MKRYAFAGASGRALNMFIEPIVYDYSESCEIVGVFDVNSDRCEIVREKVGGSFPSFDDFDKMLAETKPDTVIVTTVDGFHHEYIIRSMEFGCDVIVEKPITTDEEKLRRILEAERKTGQQLIVTFNYRFVPYNVELKRILREGDLGSIFHVDFELTLDMIHGASYFRRWHSEKAKSGTLLVHKATHYFDLFNWWIEQEPVSVYALGSLRYYGANREERGERCLTCDHKESCLYYWNIENDEFASEFYLKPEKEDGYIRDRCIFHDKVDIYDTMSVMVAYDGGTTLNFSLNAHSPYENWKMAVHCEKGKLEAEELRTGPASQVSMEPIRVYNRYGQLLTHSIPRQPVAAQRDMGIASYTRKGHKGGDVRIQRAIFHGLSEDPYGLMADSRAGALSALCGIAATRSIEQGGKVIKMTDLVPEDLLYRERA